MIRQYQVADAAAIVAIYNHYVEHSIITFDLEPWSVAQMQQKLDGLVQANYPVLVFEHQGQIEGYAYASQWKPKGAYRFAVESTIYLRPDSLARGIGRGLYLALIDDLRQRGYRIVLGCVTVPNEASDALHRKLGFEQVAYFKQIGIKFDHWHDVVYWQLHL